MPNRRDILKTGVLGAAAAASGLPLLTSPARATTGPTQPLDILILGGTGFIGPHMVREALRRRHSVTLFNRGKTNEQLFPDLETIVGDRNNGLDGLEGRQWDVVIDNSGYVPRHVRDSARLLAPRVSRYVFISTVAVYADFTRDRDEDSALATIADESIEQVTRETYGALKALCEAAVHEELDSERVTVLRPTYICGPGDHTDRFTWWPVRVARGGEMLWPGRPEDPIQTIDVRDVANFTIDCVEQAISGTYNLATEERGYSMGDLLTDSRAISAADVEAIWISEAFARSAGETLPVKNQGAFPIWRPQRGPDAASGQFISTAARQAGLDSRPVRETIRDLMSWWETLPAERSNNPRAGIPPEFEAELITRWKQDHA